MSLVSVILCHHTGDFVQPCIDSIEKSLGLDWEIIVVTSVLASKRNYEFKGAKTIFFYGGPSEKRNIGAKHANGKYLFFLDDDTEVEPDFLLHMKNALDQPGVGMAYGKTLNMERRNMLDNAGSYLTWTGFLWAREESGIEDKGQFDDPEDIFAGKGAAMALRRDTFDKVGGFDPVYEILAEETDISWKVWFIGERVVWVPKAVLFHAFNTKFKPWSYYYTSKRVYYNGARNYVLMLCKFLEVKNLLRILPIHIPVWLFAGLGMILTGKWEAGLLIWKGILYHLNPINILDTIKRRSEVQKLRTKSDSQLAPFIMRSPSLMFYIKRLIHYVQTGRHG